MIKAGQAVRGAVFLVIVTLAFFLTIQARGERVETREITLYFVDAEMLRLMPVKTTIPVMNTQKSAERVINELIRGRDENPKIRRIIPNSRRCMTVKVKGETAYVDFKLALLEGHPTGRDLELLTVYSVVNSLTALDGIKTVRFTIRGKTQKTFMGFLDMRETFVPDYFI